MGINPVACFLYRIVRRETTMQITVSLVKIEIIRALFGFSDGKKKFITTFEKFQSVYSNYGRGN